MTPGHIITDYVNASLVVLCLFNCLYLWQRKRTLNMALLTTFAIYMALALSLLFEIKFIYRITDATFLPFHNLPWLITIIFKSIMGHFVIWSIHQALQRSLPHQFHILSGSVITLLTFIFFVGGLHQSPTTVIHLTATTMAEAIFLSVFFLYGGLLTLWGFTLILQLLRHRTGFVARFRFSFALVNSIFVLGFVISSIVLTWLGLFYHPNHPAIFQVFHVTVSFIIGAGLTILPFYWPQRHILQLARFLDRLWAVKAVWDLQPLGHQLDQYCPPLLERESLTLRQIYTTVELRRHQMLVDILDRKMLLQHYLQLPLTELAELSDYLGEWIHHHEQRCQAQQLLARLQQINDNQTFTDLVKAYRHISQRIK